MDYVVTCDGTPIGSVSIVELTGLPHAELRPNDAYESVREHSVGATLRFRAIKPGSIPGDFAEWFASTWTGGRLALENTYGEEIAVASVMIMQNVHARVVIDVRPDSARTGALIRPADHPAGDRSRPAA